MALNKNSKMYKQLVANLKKDRAARWKNAKARRSIIIPEAKPFQPTPKGNREEILTELAARRDRLNVAIEVLRELEG